MPHSVSYVSTCAKRAKGGRDDTYYGRSTSSTKSFFIHHTQRISLAAAKGNIAGLCEMINYDKAKLARGAVCAFGSRAANLNGESAPHKRSRPQGAA